MVKKTGIPPARPGGRKVERKEARARTTHPRAKAKETRDRPRRKGKPKARAKTVALGKVRALVEKAGKARAVAAGHSCQELWPIQ